MREPPVPIDFSERKPNGFEFHKRAEDFQPPPSADLSCRRGRARGMAVNLGGAEGSPESVNSVAWRVTFNDGLARPGWVRDAIRDPSCVDPRDGRVSTAGRRGGRLFGQFLFTWAAWSEWSVQVATGTPCGPPQRQRTEIARSFGFGIAGWVYTELADHCTVIGRMIRTGYPASALFPAPHFFSPGRIECHRLILARTHP